MKKPSTKIVTLTLIGLLFFGFVMCCSGWHMPFISPRWTLARHLRKDFGVTLPASTVIDNAYFVGARDPEEVFGIHMPPADIHTLIAALKATAAAKRYTMGDADQAKPLYGKPPWWNNPTMTDCEGFAVTINEAGGIPASAYGVLYSPSSGRAYVVWGGF